MGLLGNVAEVKRLRYRLMTAEFINVFSNLLDSTGDGIEVIYIFFFNCVYLLKKMALIFFISHTHFLLLGKL